MKHVRIACDTQHTSILLCELTAEEMCDLRPEERFGRLTLMFLRNYVQLVDLDVAQALSHKYSFLHIVDAYGNRLDTTDDLDTLEGSETRKLAYLYKLAADYDINAVGMSPFEIKLAIRDARNETALFAGRPIAEAGTFHRGAEEA